MLVAKINAGIVPHGREDIAQMILTAFAEAGFGVPQQLAALANAMEESNLNPAAAAVGPEEAVGLFQLDRRHGLGSGHTKAELEDPSINIRIIVSAAQKSREFTDATTIGDAVAAFVSQIERPADKAGAIDRRTKIAERLAQTA